MLRYFTSTLVACALAASVSVFAQEPAPQQPEMPQAPQPEEPQLPKETLTGCVIEAKTTDGETAYVLNKVKGGSAEMYVLAGASPSELAQNVNKEVTVTGPVQEPTPQADGSAAADSTVLRPPAVKVESVKVVAEECQ